MKIQKRRVNSKRHTLSYKIAGRWRTRKQAYDLAKAGKIDGVIACRGECGGYIQSHPSNPVKLYDLEEVIE
jgi:hypothetical protein